MQEGTPAFVQMVRICQAVWPHKAAGLPYLVYLRHPTTGGVMASWGSLGHVTVAEPGALVGFLGPRVYEALYDRPFPEGVQTSENLYAHGIIDAVVAARGDRRHPRPRAGHPAGAPRRRRPPCRPRPRRRSRTSTPGTRCSARGARTGPAYDACCKYAASDVVPLNGTGQGEADPGLLIALARFGRRRASSSARTAAARPPTTRWDRRRCARPGAGCGSPPSSGCRW